MKRGRNYTSIWNTEKVIYSIFGISLQGPVPFRFLVSFGITFVAMLILHVTVLGWFDFFIFKFIAIPGLVGWISLQRLDGKPLYLFLTAWGKHRGSPKKYAGYRALQTDAKREISWAIPYRQWGGDRK
ncbi:conjugal transfer protein [Kroppenstedtia guangzhouensis]|uniref:Conjugal transfer protein n=1 Tax=Kroppenstedtia guangzhouensis TaxID=1274356 RepID=A0ABQ1H520_9BACL|nr:TcpE family conjugal transfer membrane protein [Kroppenstedtia guangzhouensis]GGA58051.1 conjugal transfer protein [Kroppenstedtia guangzhouensis]